MSVFNTSLFKIVMNIIIARNKTAGAYTQFSERCPMQAARVSTFSACINDSALIVKLKIGIKRVTKGFNSKNACTSRVYEYLLPTYAVSPLEVNVITV